MLHNSTKLQHVFARLKSKDLEIGGFLNVGAGAGDRNAWRDIDDDCRAVSRSVVPRRRRQRKNVLLGGVGRYVQRDRTNRVTPVGDGH